ncbi:MAG: hypothetical protein SF339_25335 [Blastocatellia bacterium]|nr:hypothetical protein [Blastocatellia bacterium]
MAAQFDRRMFIASSLLAAGALAAPARAEEFQALSLRGRIVCLTEELQKDFQITPSCDSRGHLYALKTSDGKLYPFLPIDTAAAVWLDERYRTRDLQISARLFPQTNFIEVIKFQSWVDGALHDLYYYCDVCAISTHKPGPCDCCQDPVVFTEKLVNQ